MKDEHVYKSHNKSLLLYHLVFPAKYRKKVFTTEVEHTLVEVCEDISKRYEINFVEIGNDLDHIHFLVQSVPMMRVSEIVMIVKSITAKKIFKKHKEVKKVLWGGSLWTSGYYVNTVGQYASKDAIVKYIQNQGKSQKYQKLHQGQLSLEL
jgi:REP element-mobilizing transposase RayT